MKIKACPKPVTDKDRALLAAFMGYMREGGEIGEAMRQRAVKQAEAESATRRDGR
jgi:hypothetical protein